MRVPLRLGRMYSSHKETVVTCTKLGYSSEFPLVIMPSILPEVWVSSQDSNEGQPCVLNGEKKELLYAKQSTTNISEAGQRKGAPAEAARQGIAPVGSEATEGSSRPA